MEGFQITPTELSVLRLAHKKQKRKRDADKIKAIVLLAESWTQTQVAQALLLDEETIRNYKNRYQREGLEGLLHNRYKGGSKKLSTHQLKTLDRHLDEHIYQSVQDVVRRVKKSFGVNYSVSGMTSLLHQLGYVYKKPKAIPGKANSKAQQEFVEFYKKLKENKGKNDPVYFMDGTHPHHNTLLAYGWIKRGVEKEIKTNTGRRRLNINGAIDIDNKRVVTDFPDSVNAQSTIRLFKKIEKRHAQAQTIYVVCDNARYYRSRMVKEFLEKSKIELIFLPPYSPNLNLIERLWKLFHKQVLYNKYYESFDEMESACLMYFRYIRKYRKQLDSLLIEHFHIFKTINP